MERTWINRYDAGVPGQISYPDCTVPDLPQRSAARASGSIALFFYATRISYGDYDDLTTHLAMTLLPFGVRQGDPALWGTARHHQGLARKQLLMTQQVKAEKQLFAVEALLWYASQPVGRDQELADGLLRHCCSQIEEAFDPSPLLSFKRPLREDDSRDFHLAQNILAGKGECLEDKILPWHPTRQPQDDQLVSITGKQATGMSGKPCA